jgi:hypothetical protein
MVLSLSAVPPCYVTWGPPPVNQRERAGSARALYFLPTCGADCAGARRLRGLQGWIDLSCRTWALCQYRVSDVEYSPAFGHKTSRGRAQGAACVDLSSR